MTEMRSNGYGSRHRERNEAISKTLFEAGPGDCFGLRPRNDGPRAAGSAITERKA